MHFEERVAFQGDVDVLWQRVSDIDAIPRYWHGTKSLEITGREGETVSARVTFAFGGTGEAKISADQSSKTLTISYVSGPFRGDQVVSIRGSELTAMWDVKFAGLFRLVSRWNESHFRSGTRHALERLVGADREVARWEPSSQGTEL